MICGAILGVNIRIASPKGFEPLPSVVQKANALRQFDATITLSNDPVGSVKGAQVIYTDVWASMGQEKEQIERKKVFKDFCLNGGEITQGRAKSGKIT